MSKCKILFLAANPEGTSQLALDKNKAEGFTATAGRLQTHITNIVSWLGDSAGTNSCHLSG